MEKNCIRCNISKELKEFNKSNCTKGGYKNICKVCRKEYNRNNRENNKKYLQKYHTVNKNKIKEKRKEYNKNNQDKIKNYSKNYYEINKKDIISKISLYIDNRKKTDPIFKLKCNLRTRLSKFLCNKNITKNKKTEKLIGTTYEDLKNHIENQFTEGMSWDNYGKWHIDHITPLCSASNKDEIYKLFNYENLQPLWALDNIKKGGKF